METTQHKLKQSIQYRMIMVTVLISKKFIISLTAYEKQGGIFFFQNRHSISINLHKMQGLGLTTYISCKNENEKLLHANSVYNIFEDQKS